MLGFIRRAPNRSTAELLLPIATMSSPTIGNTNVACWRYVINVSMNAFLSFLL